MIIDGVCDRRRWGCSAVWYARRTLRPIRETYAAQKRFVADASHELRTPLAIVKTDFDVALLDERAGLEAAALRRDLEEIERMAAIVDDLLLLSRIDARQEELRLAQLDLSALVRHVVEKLRPLAGRRGVAITVTAPEGAVTVAGDAPHLERALLNLVRTPSSTRPPEARSASRCTSQRTGSVSRCRTQARASRRRSCRTSSTASTAPTPRAPASAAAVAWASPSRAGRWNATAVP